MCTQMGEMIDLFLLALIAGFITVAYRFRSKQKKKNLPPSPLGFPVIGHLHLLKEPVHRSLRDLSRNLGSDVFFLRLGSRRAVVVTSASAAEEFLSKENDVIFANRPLASLTEFMGYNCTIVSAAPYGEHWRRLRRFCSVKIFSAACLRDSSDIRRGEVRALLRRIHVELVTSGGNDFVRLKLQPLLYGLTFNILMSIVDGKREEDDETKEVRELIREAFEFSGVSYVGDFLPILKLFDHDGYLKGAKKLSSKLDKFMQKLVDEHRRNRGKTELEKTMITHLLSLQESEPEHYTDDIIKGLVQDLLILLAGTDTTAVTLEWAMANLLNHPEVLMKLKTELNNVSVEGRLLEESDTGKCPYLTNVISETLRLYPAAPLLVPHASSADSEVAGFDISRGTWLFVNAWAIQRDPNVWDDPEAFKPERFESETHRGKYLPFGIGRRACPGMGLAQLVLSLALGSLIQCFDWERDNDVPVDMSEGRGITMPKAVPLVAKCKSLPILDKVVL